MKRIRTRRSIRPLSRSSCRTARAAHGHLVAITIATCRPFRFRSTRRHTMTSRCFPRGLRDHPFHAPHVAVVGAGAAQFYGACWPAPVHRVTSSAERRCQASSATALLLDMAAASSRSASRRASTWRRAAARTCALLRQVERHRFVARAQGGGMVATHHDAGDARTCRACRGVPRLASAARLSRVAAVREVDGPPGAPGRALRNRLFARLDAERAPRSAPRAAARSTLAASGPARRGRPCPAGGRSRSMAWTCALGRWRVTR